MGNTHGLRKLMMPASSATLIAGSRLASMISIPNMRSHLTLATPCVTGSDSHMSVDMLKHRA